MKLPYDISNKKFNKLTAIKIHSVNRSGNYRWTCICDCGREVVYSQDHLTRKTSPVKSCGCERRKYGKKHKDWNGCGDISGAWWASRVLRERTQNIRSKIPVEIDIKYAWELFIKQDRKCSLSGIELRIGHGVEYNASIDRIDSNKGYVVGNIQWVDKHVNFMKRTMTMETFIDFCKKIAGHNK